MAKRSFSATEPKEIVRALVEAWNSHDIERICSFFHEDFENDQAPLGVVRGLDAYRKHLREWFAAYPDLRVEIETLFAEGELVSLETRSVGSGAGPFFRVEPERGKRVNRALDVLVLRGGKVWRQRGYWDFSLWTGHRSPLTRGGRGAPGLRRSERPAS